MMTVMTYTGITNDFDFPQCIDDWLMRSFTCPSCMEPVDAALLGEFKIYQKNMSWFWWTPCFNFLLRLDLVNWFTHFSGLWQLVVVCQKEKKCHLVIWTAPPSSVTSCGLKSSSEKIGNLTWNLTFQDMLVHYMSLQELDPHQTPNFLSLVVTWCPVR